MALFGTDVTRQLGSSADALGLDEIAINDLIEELLARQYSAILLNLASGVSERALFNSGFAGELSLHLSATASENCFKKFTPCSINLVLGSTAFSFLSSVVRFDSANTKRLNHARIVIRTPHRVTFFETRRSVRIPIVESSRVQFDLRCESHLFTHLEAIDISTSGILLRLPDNADFPALNDRVFVEMNDGKRTLAVESSVRRREGDECGILFTQIENDEQVASQVRRLIGSIEREWLRNRKDRLEM